MNEILSTASNLGDKVVNTVNNVADDIKEATKSTIDSAKQAIHDQTMTDEASKYMQKGVDSIHDAGNQIKSTAMKCANGCSNFVSEKPMKSVAIAVALGALFALLILNKSR